MNPWVDSTLAVLQSWVAVATASVLHALVFAAILLAAWIEATRGRSGS
jgi:hypothetical protein